MFSASVFPRDKVTDNPAPTWNKLRYKTSLWHLIKVATFIKANTEPLFSLGLGDPQAVWHPSYHCHHKDVVRDSKFCFLYRESFWAASQLTVDLLLTPFQYLPHTQRWIFSQPFSTVPL